MTVLVLAKLGEGNGECASRLTIRIDVPGGLQDDERMDRRAVLVVGHGCIPNKLKKYWPQ